MMALEKVMQSKDKLDCVMPHLEKRQTRGGRRLERQNLKISDAEI
jgi:hypothetical protein